MKRLLLALELILILGTPGIASAQENSITADIVYLYLGSQSTASRIGTAQGLETLESLETAIAPKRPDQTVLLFQDSNDHHDFVAITQGIHADEPIQLGWNKLPNQNKTSTTSEARAFVLRSTLLSGNPKLNATKRSYVTIKHVDSDPKKRNSNPPLFQQLEQILNTKAGFQGLQVWTWDARPNHWTVIEAWNDTPSQQRAQQSPEIVILWDLIYSNTAAPKNESSYRLVN